MELRLWSDFNLRQGRYIVIISTPNKKSSLSTLNGFDVYSSLYGNSPLMSNGIIRLIVGSMAVLGANAPANMVHVVINNGAHETVGGMPTVASKISLVY